MQLQSILRKGDDMAITTVEQLRTEFEAGIVTAIKYEGFTKFTCKISGASWAVVKRGVQFEIIAEFIHGAAFNFSEVYALLNS